MNRPWIVICLAMGLLTALIAEEEAVIDIVLIGDFTVTDAAGWGRTFADRCLESVTVHNLAVSGRSARSWYDERRLPAALALKPDIAFIQFGHNDQPGKGPERETDPATTYRDLLRLYVAPFREIGARVIADLIIRDLQKLSPELTRYLQLATDRP